jgi:uncharacterized protein YndB with AHSA1/START domain
MNSRIEARASHHFKAAAERVYDAWLDPEKARVWMSASLKSLGLAGEIRRIEIDARVGGKFFFSDMRDGTEARHWGSYLELDPPRKIVFTWIVDESEEADPSIVTITIQSDPEGCTATIVHEMDAQWAEYLSRTESGWTRMLQAVDRFLAYG